MALRTGHDDWQELLTKIGIPADSARTYAKTFVEENINHVEAFEAALHDQAQISGTFKMSALCVSTYRKKKKKKIPLNLDAP